MLSMIPLKKNFSSNFDVEALMGHLYKFSSMESWSVYKGH
jgi:hypothetical protein